MAEGTSRIDRSETPDTVIDTDELSADTLAAAGRTAATLQSISSVLSEPAALLGDYTSLEAVVSSASWRSDPKSRNAQNPLRRGGRRRRHLLAGRGAVVDHQRHQL